MTHCSGLAISNLLVKAHCRGDLVFVPVRTLQELHRKRLLMNGDLGDPMLLHYPSASKDLPEAADECECFVFADALSSLP